MIKYIRVFYYSDSELCYYKDMFTCYRVLKSPVTTEHCLSVTLSFMRHSLSCSSLVLWELRILVEIWLALFKEGLASFLCFIKCVVEHGGVTLQAPEYLPDHRARR